MASHLLTALLTLVLVFCALPALGSPPQRPSTPGRPGTISSPST